MSRSAKRASLYFACLSFTFCVLVLALVGTATGATRYVPSEDYKSIQTAIDAAEDGDEIEVAPGTYFEAINFLGKAIRLYSSGGPELTTIDASGLNSSVVTCNSGENANTILEGFTIKGGNTSNGGGIYNDNSSPTVTNCIFTGNQAGTFGGGMYNTKSSPTVTNCTFADNTADAGGGMSNYAQSSPTVSNCTFRENYARAAGGMHNHVGSSPTVTNCIFTGNIAYHDNGGMINHSGSNAILTNCTFIGNSAGRTVGGIQNAYSSATLTNCTFSGNTAGVDYGGMWDRGNSNSTVTNCIFWGNTPNEITVYESDPTITYSDVQGGWTGTGNINADPMFVSPAEGDFRLSWGSPCIDAGDNAAVPADITTDLDGNPRIVNKTVDMGAYEYRKPMIWIPLLLLDD